MSKESDTPAAPLTAAAADGDPALSPERLVSNDPVFIFLHRTLGGKLTVTINVLAAAVVFFGGAALNGGLFNKNYAKELDRSTARLLDAATSLRKILLILLGLSVYFLLPRWIASLFNSLRRNRVITDERKGDASYAQFLDETCRKIDRKAWAALGAAAVALFWVHRVTDFDGSSRPVWLEVLALAVYALAFYVFPPTIIKLLLFLLSTNRLFNSFHIRVNPLHPDNVGGLGAVGRTLLNYVMIFAAFALLVAAGMVSAYYRSKENLISRTETQLLVAGYALFPFLLWGWLWVPHKAMRDARDEKLLILAEEFVRATPDKDAKPPTDPAPVKENTDRLHELKRQYELLRESYPTWPIRFRQVNRIIALAGAPLLTTALPEIIGYLGGFIPSLFKP